MPFCELPDRSRCLQHVVAARCRPLPFIAQQSCGRCEPDATTFYFCIASMRGAGFSNCRVFTFSATATDVHRRTTRICAGVGAPSNSRDACPAFQIMHTRLQHCIPSFGQHHVPCRSSVEHHCKARPNLRGTPLGMVPSPHTCGPGLLGPAPPATVAAPGPPRSEPRPHLRERAARLTP